MTAMFLTREDVVELTGYRTRGKQIDALGRMGIRFHVPPDGWPRVPKGEITNGNDNEPTQRWEPRFPAAQVDL